MADQLPRLYTDLADWFHLLTAPEEYAEEAAFYLTTIVEASDASPRALLELGSGGGNNAWHYKRNVGQVTLTDLSEGMLEQSRRINPDCEHVQGDMRTLRLGRVYDAVFVHDAVSYLTTLDDLRQAVRTAFVHCRPGGVALFAPDHVREIFEPATDHGGNDGEGRALRYLEWTFDPDPSDSTYLVDYACLLHEDGQPTRVAYDRHVCGLFDRDDWLRLLGEVGFENARALPFEHSEVPPGSLEVFVAVKPR
jgi:SAM-dependent methyltransferase